MTRSVHMPVRILWAGLTLALPALLLSSAFRTYRALDNQRLVYLRSRVAAIASLLENLPSGILPEHVRAYLEDEPGLLDVVILSPPSGPASGPLAPLWEGRELFRTETLRIGDEDVFRAHVPFHDQNTVWLARIDLAAATADFLIVPARQHLWVVAFGGLVIVALSLLTAWNVRRAGVASRRQLELEHLAHIGELSAILAHEIRNPLGTIKGFAQLLQERHVPGDAGLLNPILSETARLEQLVKDLLLYGRPAQPSLRPTQSATIAGAVASHAHHALGASGVLFAVGVPDVTFTTDPNLLEQALLNLVRNSIEAVGGQSEGVVRLELDLTAHGILWRVHDNGPGFSADALRRLYEPFYTSKAFGTGLGLSITRKLVQALGGRLSVSNRPEGGTLAEIHLPHPPPAP
jgi:two-component system sensor histidine kinase HydH